MIRVKRVYADVSSDDGTRILVDRLWPRGVSKDKAAIDEWAKELAPSKELFTWFHTDKENRFDEFRGRYLAELNEKESKARAVIAKSQTITLVTSVKDLERSHIPTLQAFIEQL